MAGRTVEIRITGTTAQLNAALASAGIAADEASTKIGTKFDAASTKAGGAFSKLGRTIQGVTGLPVASAFDKMGSSMVSADTKGKKLAGTMSTIGKGALIGLAGAAVLVAAKSVDMGAKFQSAMEKIHTQAGASQSEVNKMSKAVLNLAGPTATAPDELAAGLYHLESAGMHGKRALDALKVAAEGAKVGGANLEDVTNALNAAVSSGIPGVQSMQGAMGSLNAIVGAGDMRMQNLADALGTGVLAAVKGYGVTMTDAGAALATFGDNNIRGADAASQLRQGVMAMAKPVSSGAAALKSLGLTTSTLAVDMQQGGLNKAVTDLHDRLVATGNTGAKSGKILVDAFGKKAGVGIQVLEGQFNRFKSKITEVDKGSKSFGKSWKGTTQTLSFQMDSMKETVAALATKLGTALIPKLQSLMKVIAKVVSWLMKHKAIAMILAGVIGGFLVAAIAAYTISMAAAAVATIAAAAPVLLVIAVIGALIAAAYEVYTHWSQIWGGIKAIVGDAFGFIKAHYDILLAVFFGPIGLAIGELAKHWHGVWTGIQTVVQTVWGVVKPIFDTITSAIKTITHGISDVAGAAGKLGGGVIGAIGGLLAGGGPATAGVPYIVGEQGPELFVPGQSGVVVPNSSLVSAIAHPQGSPVAAATGGQPGAQTIQVFAETNASPQQIAAEVSWAMKTAAH